MAHLTAKQISLAGYEVVVACDRVEYSPSPVAGQVAAPRQDHGGTVDVFEAGVVVASFREGTVFVMNERGSTVSRYDLGGSDVPVDSMEARRVPRFQPARDG